MIETIKLTKRFEGFTALNELSLRVEKGSVYGLVGSNGAGKTTLIKHLSGVCRQDEGEALIDGQRIYENPEVKRRVACIPDELFFFNQAGISDMRAFYKRCFPEFSDERFEKLRQAFPLDEKQPLRRFSKGMRKQAAFWLAIARRPDVLLLDEPVDGLDPVMRRQVWSLILGDVAERGMTVLVSSHNLRELEDVCDHVGIIDRGAMLLERSLSELQGGVVKVQAVFEEGLPTLPQDIKLLHSSCSGRIYTLIIRGEAEYTKNVLSTLSPLLLDVLPLTLEEIFIYELGGADYAVKDIVL